jgi:hypothetical protein
MLLVSWLNGQMTIENTTYAMFAHPSMRPTCAIITPRLSLVLSIRLTARRPSRIATTANRVAAQSNTKTSKSNCGARLARRYSPGFATSAIDPMMTETRRAPCRLGSWQAAVDPRSGS